MTEGRPLQRDEKAIAIVNIINSRNNRKRVDPSFPFLALSTLSQQVIKRWEERGTVKKRKEGSNIDESLPFHTLFLDSSSL